MAQDPAENAPGRDPNPLFADHSVDANFGRTVARGGMVTAVAQAVSLGLNLLAFPLLSRLLTPEDIGLVAITTVVTTIALAFAESGLSTAAIQSPSLSRHQASNLFWLNVLLSLVAMAVCLAAAPGVGWFYGDSRLVPLVVATSLTIPIFGLGVQHTAMLRRTLQMDRIAYATLTAAIVSNALALLIAWLYHSYWALAVKVVAQAAVMTTMAWTLCPWVPGRPKRGVGSQRLATFGLKVFGSRMLFTLSQSADTALLGRIASPAAVGLYDRGFQLLVAPIRQINGPLAGLLLPALSRCRANESLYRSLFLSVSTLIVAAAAPMSALVVGAPDWCVSVAMGDGWEAAVPVFRLVGLGVALSPLFNASSWLFTSQNRVGEMMKWQAFDAAWRVVLLAGGAFFGLYGIVWATVLRVYTMPHGFYWALGKKGPVGLVDYFKLEATALLTSGVGLLSVLGFRGLTPTDISPWIGLPIAGLAAVCSTTLVLCVLPESRDRLSRSFRLLFRRNAPAAAGSTAP